MLYFELQIIHFTYVIVFMNEAKVRKNVFDIGFSIECYLQMISISLFYGVTIDMNDFTSCVSV